MGDVLAIIFIFGSPAIIYATKRFFDAVDKGRVGLPAGRRGAGGGEDVQRLEQENASLTERVRLLEGVVVGLDTEMNGRLALVHRQVSQVVSGATHAAAPTGALPAAPATLGGAWTAPELTSGTRLANRFVVDRLLGRGGMGAVYAASDEVLGEPVAIKVVGGLVAADQGMLLERFKREANAARRITHSNVIRVHDVVQDAGGSLILSMELFPADSLEDLLARNGQLPLTTARDLLLQVCDGLAAAHQAGVIHRDLKPGNVLVATDGKVKVIDFGLARVTHLEGMTATGLIMGTPEYMAPEQVRGQPTDARTDIYALGLVAYRTVTGKVAFTADNPIAVGFAHCTKDVVPPAELRKDLPKAWNEAVLKALQKEPLQRQARVEDFRRVLEQA